jgi:hypothetical protein
LYIDTPWRSALIDALNDRSRSVIGDPREGAYEVTIDPLDKDDAERLLFELDELGIRPDRRPGRLLSIAGFDNLKTLASLGSATDPDVTDQLDTLVEAVSPVTGSASG